MNEHSAWRLALAREIAPVYCVHPEVEACFVFGSAALGMADQYSDLELAFVWSQLPSAEVLRAAVDGAGATAWEIEPRSQAADGWLEQFCLRGMKVETGHWSRHTIESTLTDVVERCDVSQTGLLFEKQAIAHHVEHAVALKGDVLIQEWRDRLSPYPDALAIAMIQAHLNFRPFDGQKVLTDRLELPMLYENRCAIARRVINILFGLNRMYYPGFKWTRHWVLQMKIKPPNFFDRLQRALQTDAYSVPDELQGLVEETFDLVALYFPQIDLDIQRATFALRNPRWPLSSDQRSFPCA